jgi:diguanylate cyclase (GGDEF)-like protein/PAS domain S-box-containing protein
MASKTDNLVRLVIAEDSVEEAEQVISVLRNAGMAVRPTRVDEPQALETALEASPDLIVVGSRVKKVPAGVALQLVNRVGKDIPVIQLVEQLSTEQLAKWTKDGVRNFALRGASEHIQIIVRREFADLQARRNVRRFESTWRDSERRAEALMESSRDPIAYIHEGMHVRANKAYLEMFRFEDFSEIEGMAILDMIAGKDADEFKSILRNISKGEKPPERVNLKAQRGDGSNFDAVMELSEASIDGEGCLQIVFRQQTVSSEIAEELEKYRREDPLSGLLNRQTFADELQKGIVVAVGGKTDQALSYVDIDDYKRHLDAVGVAGTDVLIGQLGTLIKKHLKDHDRAGRFADHVFTILWTNRSHEQSQQSMRGLLKAISDHIFEVGNTSISMTCSGGHCLFSEKASSHEILQRGAEACRRAQNDGGNRIEVFDPLAKEKALEAEVQQWVSVVKNALSKDGFSLLYQPIVSLTAEPGERYEVLLRLAGPNGLVMPGVFLPVAERVGLLPHIDRWVIARVIQTIAERERSGRQTIFFVKIMPESIADGSILPWLAQQLKNARVPGERLIFEMPESKVVTNLKPARFFQKGLEQLRCGFAIEQFGSGLQSFQLLKHVPANIVKIDRSLMADLAKSPELQTKLKEVAGQVHDQGKQTVCEFVEDAQTMAVLFGANVTFVQGNFLQPPQSVMEYEFG